MKRKKLLLINPGNPTLYSYTPPLALGYVAAVTPSDWEIEIIDENTRGYDYAAMHADLVGVSAMTPQAYRAYQIAEMFTLRNIPAVLGGIHVSMLPDEALQYATSVVVGEGEPLWPEVIRDFENGTMERIYRSPHFQDLTDLPFPRRELYPGRYPFDVIKTTRGCPFGCDFCCVSAFNGSQYRVRPVEAVIEELKQIKHKLVLFADDNILVDGRTYHDRAKFLFEEMIRQKLNKFWLSQASVKIIEDREMLRLMQKSGCKGLLIGFESLEQQTLQDVGKRHNLKKSSNEEFYRSVVDTLHHFGIAVIGFFFSSPSEDKETFRGMTEFFKKSRIDLITHTILTPLPGTKLFEKFSGELCYHDFPRDWDKFDFSRLVMNPTAMSPQEFYTVRQNMVREIHSWTRILKQACQGLVYSKNLLLPLLIIASNVFQKKSYHREFRRICAELGKY